MKVHNTIPDFGTTVTMGLGCESIGKDVIEWWIDRVDGRGVMIVCMIIRDTTDVDKNLTSRSHFLGMPNEHDWYIAMKRTGYVCVFVEVAPVNEIKDILPPLRPNAQWIWR